MDNMGRFQRVVSIGGMVLALIATTPSRAKSFSSLVFDESDPQAIIMSEELTGLDGGILLFRALDPAIPRLGGGSFQINKDVWFGRLKTRYPELQDYILPSFFSGYSRFSAVRRPAGVYAFVLHQMTTGSNQGEQCIKAAMPVFRFKPGVANLIPNAAMPQGGYSNFLEFRTLFFAQKIPESVRQAGAPDPLVAAQRVLDERPGIKARVEYAEFLGYVAWQNSKGEISGCNQSSRMVWVTPEMARDAKVQD